MPRPDPRTIAASETRVAGGRAGCEAEGRASAKCMLVLRPRTPHSRDAMNNLEVREERNGDEPPEGLEGDGGDGDDEEANVPSDTEPVG